MCPDSRHHKSPVYVAEREYDSAGNCVVQYKDAFLKENPTYKWYNPAKHAQVISKCGDPVPTSTTHTYTAAATSDSSVEQISAGKLAGNMNNNLIMFVLKMLFSIFVCILCVN